MNPVIKERYAKIRALTKKDKVFKWQNLCQSLNSTHNSSEILKFAQIFGVPPHLWDNPRKVCSLITPRVTDFLEKVHCDNADESTMEGDPVGDIPEYLKYTHKASNGKVYCSSIVDLYNAVRVNQKMDPYRRFELDVNDINLRYEFLKNVIEPQGLGSTIMDNIKNMAIQLTPQAVMHSKLMTVWGALRYPKYTIDQVMNASEPVINGIWESVSVQDGLVLLITEQERSMYSDATDRNVKLRVLVDTMFRLISNDDSGIIPVALELAINNSVERSNVTSWRPNVRRRSSTGDNVRNVSPRLESESDEEELSDEDDSDSDSVRIPRNLPYRSNTISYLEGRDLVLYREIWDRISNISNVPIHLFYYPDFQLVRCIYKSPNTTLSFDGWIPWNRDSSQRNKIAFYHDTRYGSNRIFVSTYRRNERQPPCIVRVQEAPEGTASIPSLIEMITDINGTLFTRIWEYIFGESQRGNQFLFYYPELGQIRCIIPSLNVDSWILPRTSISGRERVIYFTTVSGRLEVRGAVFTTRGTSVFPETVVNYSRSIPEAMIGQPLPTS